MLPAYSESNRSDFIEITGYLLMTILTLDWKKNCLV